MKQQYWQLCPKCNGEGYLTQLMGVTSSTTRECPVCKGAKLISALTGQSRVKYPPLLPNNDFPDIKDIFPRTSTPEELGIKQVSDILHTFPMDEQNKRIIIERKESLKDWSNTLEGKEEYAERITKEKKDL